VVSTVFAPTVPEPSTSQKSRTSNRKKQEAKVNKNLTFQT